MPEHQINKWIKARQPQPPAGYEARLDALLHDLTRAQAEVRKSKPRLVLAMAVLLLMLGLSAAIAASLGVFDRFTQQAHDAQRLQQLGLTATDYQSVITIPGDESAGFPELVFTLDQAHYDGESLYISYGLSAGQAALVQVQMKEEQLTQADLRLAERIPRENQDILFTALLGQETWDHIQQQLEQKGWLSLRLHSQSLGDGAWLDDNTLLPTSQGNTRRPDEGSEIGFMEFERPLPEAARNREQLDVSLHLLRERRTYHLTREAAFLLPDSEQTVLPLHLRILKDSAARIFTAQGRFDAYAIEARAKVSAVDIKVDLFVSARSGRITDVLDTGASGDDTGSGRITGFALYADGQRCRMVEGSFQAEGEGMRIQLGFLAPEPFQTLQLIPEYDHGNEQVDEALSLFQ